MLTRTWEAQLANAASEAITKLQKKCRGQNIAAIAVDCHPWEGTLELSALTDREVEEDPESMTPEEMAAWKLFQFTAGRGGRPWPETKALAQEMNDAYEACTSARARTALVREILGACGRALAKPAVKRAIAALPKSREIAVWVTHPDEANGNYYPTGERARLKLPKLEK